MSKKSVIIITHHFPPEATGGASRIYEIVQKLKDNYNIIVVCPPPTYPFTKYKKARYFYRKEVHNDYEVIRCWTFQPSGSRPSIRQRMLYYAIFPILASFYLITHLKDVSFIVISIPPSPLLTASIVARLFKKKLLVDVRDLWADVAVSLSYISKDSLKLKLVRKFENYSLGKADLIFTNSRIVYDTMNKTLKKTNESKIKYVPFSVNLDTFKVIKGIRRKRQVVYIGNFGAPQNLEALIEAFPLVLRKIADLKLNFYGGGDHEIELKNLVGNLHMEQYIQFYNPVPRDEIPDILSQSLLGIIPLSSNQAVHYALPTKSFEYFASGLPVVAYGSSVELERVLNESGAGIYVRGDNIKDIADAIVNVISDRTNFDKYSANGRTFAEKNVFDSLPLDIEALMGKSVV